MSLKKLILPILNSKFLRNRRIPEYPYVDTPSFSLEDCTNPWLYIFACQFIADRMSIHTNPWRIIRIHRPTNQPALALRHSRLATGQTTKENYSLSECYKLNTHLTIYTQCKNTSDSKCNSTLYEYGTANFLTWPWWALLCRIFYVFERKSYGVAWKHIIQDV